MVERDLAKVEVASSSLVSRSSFFKTEGEGMMDERTDLFILRSSALELSKKAA